MYPEDHGKDFQESQHREDRYLAIRAGRYRRRSSQQLASDLTESTGTVVLRQTVYRRFRHRGPYSRRTAECVPLTHYHRRIRVDWSLTQCQLNGPMFSLRMSPDSVFRAIPDGF